MNRNMRVGFCGVGNMAGAILSAALASEVLTPAQVSAYNPTQAKLTRFTECGVCAAASNREVVAQSDLIFLGFKPQKLQEIGAELHGMFRGKCVVSMLAGVSVAKLREVLGDDVSVIRVLPNTPMIVAQGCTVIARPIDVAQHFVDLVMKIFQTAGSTMVVAEDEINRTIPLSSSSPAFFFRFLRAMMNAGEKSGIARETALELARATMHGVCHLMQETEKTPDELIAQVTSPGGTTLAALTAFDDFHFEDMIEAAFTRAVQRAEELGR